MPTMCTRFSSSAGLVAALRLRCRSSSRFGCARLATIESDLGHPLRASRWPAIAAATVIAVSRLVAEQPVTVSPTNSGVRSASSTNSPPPALTTAAR
jgi:hypothetical protein